MASNILDTLDSFGIEDIYDIADLANTLNIPPEMAEEIVIDQFHDISFMGWRPSTKLNQKNRGRYGLVFEQYFGIKQNQNSEADFHGVELKSTVSDELGDGKLTLFTLGAYYGDPQYACSTRAINTAAKKHNQYNTSPFLDTSGNPSKPDKLGYYLDDIRKEHFDKKLHKIAVSYIKRRDDGYFTYYKLEIYSNAHFNEFLQLWRAGIIKTKRQYRYNKKNKQTYITNSFSFQIPLKELQSLFGPPIIHYGTVFSEESNRIEPFSNTSISPVLLKIRHKWVVQSFVCQKYDLATDFKPICNTGYALQWEPGPLSEQYTLPDLRHFK